MKRRLLAFVAVVVVLTSSCGHSTKGSQHPAAVRWVNHVCTELSAWGRSATSASTTLRNHAKTSDSYKSYLVFLNEFDRATEQLSASLASDPASFPDGESIQRTIVTATKDYAISLRAEAKDGAALRNPTATQIRPEIRQLAARFEVSSDTFSSALKQLPVRYSKGFAASVIVAMQDDPVCNTAVPQPSTR